MFNCSCVTDYDEAEFYESEIRIAGQTHICCECQGIINIGEKYEDVIGIWDTFESQYKTCSVCLKVRKDFMECGWIHGSMWDDIHEANCEDDFCICP